MIFLMSCWTSARQAPYTMLTTDSVMSAGVNNLVASGKSGKPNFMKPYVPILSSTPARITDPGVGASTCASGSHVCSGTMGTLIAKLSAKAPSSVTCTSSGNRACSRSANAKLATPPACCNDHTR